MSNLNIKKHDKKTTGTYLPSNKIRTTIWIDNNKRKNLKVIAAQQKTTVTALIDEGLNYVLKKYL